MMLKKLLIMMSFSILLGATPKKVDALFNAVQWKQIRTYQQAFKRVKTEKEMAQIYQQALSLQEMLQSVLDKDYYDYYTQTEKRREDSWYQELEKELPIFAIWSNGDGALVIAMHFPPFLQKAKQTQGTSDDRFFQLLQGMYGEIKYFPKWIRQTWDLGGCNLLGSGYYVGLLRKMKGEWKQNPTSPFYSTYSHLKNTIHESLTSARHFCLENFRVVHELGHILDEATLPEPVKKELQTNLAKMEKDHPDFHFQSHGEM